MWNSKHFGFVSKIFIFSQTVKLIICIKVRAEHKICNFKTVIYILNFFTIFNTKKFNSKAHFFLFLLMI